jgi:hypothetical protein
MDFWHAFFSWETMKNDLVRGVKEYFGKGK